MSVFYISSISICIFVHSIVYRGKHLTTIGNNVLLNTNYSQNTYLFMTYFPEPFHNKYKSDAYIYSYAYMYVSFIVSAYVRSCVCVCVCHILMRTLWTHIVRSWACRSCVYRAFMRM